MSVAKAKAWLLAEAAKRGVELEALASSERRLSIEARDGVAADVDMSTRGGIGLRVVVDGRTGYASTEDLGEESLAWALDEAIENASLQSEGSAKLPAGGALGRHDLLDEGLSAELASKVATAVELESTIKADERVQSLNFSRYTEAQAEVEIGSTTGVDGGYRTGMAAVMAGIVMREGESVKQGYEFDASREYHQLEPGKTAMEALEKIGRHLGATPLKTGKRRAILEPPVVATLLQLLSYAISGKTLAEGKSRLAGKLGQQVASPLVSVIDDPTLKTGLASYPFDAEGTPARPVTILENGIFRSFLHNSDTAARTGQQTTGHASRTYISTLAVSPSNLLLAAGKGIGQADGIIVTDLMGVHAGANPITGDVSVQAMGLEVSGGEQRPVDDFAISFNLFELLMQVEEVGDTTEWKPAFGGGAIGAPGLSVESLSFAGG